MTNPAVRQLSSAKLVLGLAVTSEPGQPYAPSSRRTGPVYMAVAAPPTRAMVPAVNTPHWTSLFWKSSPV